VKILILIHDFRGGGAENVAVQLANQMSLEHDVILGCISTEGPVFSKVHQNVIVHNFQCKRVLASIFLVSKFIRANKFDLIISHLTHVNVSAVLASIIARYRQNLVVVEHSQINLNYQKQKNILMKLTYLSTKFLYRYAKAVVGVSYGVSQAVKDFTGIDEKTSKTIYNPIITNDFFDFKKESLVHRYFNENIPVFIYVGRLISTKRVSDLIAAFRIVSENTTSKLIVMGDGPEKTKLINEAKDLVGLDFIDFVGFVENPKPYILAADCLVLVSEWEGLPSVLIEALALDTQCVATDCPSGPNEILINGKLGYLCKVGCVESIAAAMLASLSSPKIIDSTDIKRFKADEVSAKYLEIIL